MTSPAPRGWREPPSSRDLQRSLAALHEHDVDDVVVLLRKAVGIPVEKAKAMIAEVGQRLARRMVRPDFLRQRGVTRPELIGFPQTKVGMIGGEDRNEQKY
jgi:hypothetical protein